MAYYYDPVPQVQQNIANTIRGGLSEWGNRSLEQSKLGLQKSQALYELGRNAEQDAMKRQLFEQQQAEYQRQQTPIHISELAYGTLGRDPSPETVAHLVANNAVGKALKMSGATIGEDGNLYNRQGQPYTRRDADKLGLVITGAITSSFDPGHYWDQRANELKSLKKRTPEQEAWLEQYDKKDPRLLISAYEKQRQQLLDLKPKLAAIGVKDFSDYNESLKRIDRKIEKQQDFLMQELKRNPKEGDTIPPYIENGKQIFEIYRGGKWEKHVNNLLKEAQKKAGAEFEFKSSDSNTIGRIIDRLYGAEWDEDGQFYMSGNQKDLNEATAVHRLASQIYIESAGKISHAEAVETAAKQFGKNIPSEPKENQAVETNDPFAIRLETNDPLGIRKRK